MKDTIKKVFVKNGDTEKYIVIVKDNKIIKHLDLTSEKLQEKYNEVVKLLKSTDSKYDKTEDSRALVIQMSKDGLLKFLKKEEDLISEVIYDEEEDTFVVNYCSGKTKTSDDFVSESYDVEDSYEKVIDLACKQYDTTLEELEDLNIVKNKTISKKDEIIKKFKIKNLITKKRLIALGVAGALVATGFGISELKSKKKEDNKEDNDIIIDDYNYQDPIETFIPEENIVNEDSIQFNENSTQPDIQFSTPDFILENQDIAVEIQKDIYPIMSWGTEGYDNYETLETYSYENMSDIANHIQNPEGNPNLTSTGKLIYYEKFYGNEYDSALISHFNRYRNEIIWQAYEQGNIDKARYYINEANKEIVRVIYDGQPIQIMLNDQLTYVRYSDLTPNAQKALKNICWSMFDPFINDTFTYDGEIYDQATVADRVFDIQLESSMHR